MAEMKFTPEYICTRFGEEGYEDKYHGAVIPPIAASSLHVFKEIEDYLGFDQGDPRGEYIYGRIGNPTVALLEKKIAALEGAGGALCYGSGMAAIKAAVLHCVSPGDHIVSVLNAYGPARDFFDTRLSKLGIEVTYVRGHDPSDFESAARSNTTLFYLESPSSLLMEMQDLEAVAAIAKKRGIKTVIDNTWATPLYQQPLSLGIDIVMHTMSKYIGGHSDIIGGVLCSDADTIQNSLFPARSLDGGILSPFEAWLTLRGLRTLPIRVKKSGESAMALAGFLEKSPHVKRVFYPGLASNPQADLAARQMSGFTGLLSFEPDASPEQSTRLVNSLSRFHIGVSWGGFESLAVMPMYKLSEKQAAECGGSRCLIRLYCGLEDTDELISDVSAAFAQVF